MRSLLFSTQALSTQTIQNSWRNSGFKMLNFKKEIKWSGVTTQAVQEWTFENPARLCRAQLHGHDAFEGQSRIRHGFFCKLTLF